MKRVILSFLLLPLAAASKENVRTSFPISELALGGISVGLSEKEVLRRLGPPRSRVDTGEGFRLDYAGLEVYVGVDGEGVFEVASTSPGQCTPSRVCPGMSLNAAKHMFGTPVIAKREHGSFLEYIPIEGTCWLQLSVARKKIQKLRIACQP